SAGDTCISSPRGSSPSATSASAAAARARASCRCRSIRDRSRPGPFEPGRSGAVWTRREQLMASYPANLKYTKDHEWIELNGDKGKVGITDYAQQQLGDVVYVELPEVGARLEPGPSFGPSESVKAVWELYSPVTGEVVEVNAALKDKPETVNANPHGSWMIVVKLANSGEAGGLLDAAQYEDLVK